MNLARIEALKAYEVMGSPPEPELDDVARLAARICATPVALVTLIDGQRQFFKARHGFEGVESDLETGFCPLVVEREAPVTICDTLGEPVFAVNRATIEGGIRFYAGVPLTTHEGHVLGTLCVLDRAPRSLDADQRDALAALARQVMTHLELRSALRRERESDVRHRLTLDSAVDYAIVGLDRQGVVRDWNIGAEQVLGVAAGAAVGRAFHAFLRFDRRADWLADDMTRTLAESRVVRDGLAERLDGSTFWARQSMTPLRNSHGAITGFVAVTLDRSAERRRESSLALLAHAAAGLLSTDDPDMFLDQLLAECGSVIGFEHAYSHVITPDGQHLRLTASIGLSPEDRATYANAPFDAVTCASVIETRQQLVVNDLQSTDDARCAPARGLGLTAYAAFPVMVSDHVYGVLSFGSLHLRQFDDEALAFFATLARYVSMVRERMAAEQASKDFARALEQRVAERTAALQDAEAALRHSQKIEAVGQLTGGVAHDFNNLLTIIRSSTDLLRRPGLAEERRQRYLDAVSETVERAAKLTGQLLAFARRQALTPEVFDVVARLRSLADLLDSVTGARIRVVAELPAHPCCVEADASQFETALVNMAVNARDSMDGEGTLTIRATTLPALPPIRGHAGNGERFVAVSLSDTGAGIAPDTIGRIFEPFFTTKDVGKGTGLGLSQVFGFAKQSGGDVDVSSVHGAGATFTLYLPAVASAAVPVLEQSDRTATPGSGQHVLIVEDNLEIGRFVEQILEDMNYRCRWAKSASEALRFLEEESSAFDAVFSDVVMPGGMNGIDLAREIKRRWPEIPVVLTSGYSHVLAEGGPQGFRLLHKPYSVDQLAQVLSQAVGPSLG